MTIYDARVLWDMIEREPMYKALLAKLHAAKTDAAQRRARRAVVTYEKAYFARFGHPL